MQIRKPGLSLATVENKVPSNGLEAKIAMPWVQLPIIPDKNDTSMVNRDTRDKAQRLKARRLSEKAMLGKSSSKRIGKYLLRSLVMVSGNVSELADVKRGVHEVLGFDVQILKPFPVTRNP